MSGKTNAAFTPEEISRAAQGNVKYLCLAMVDYLKQHGQSLDEFWGFVGQRFAPSWEGGPTARQVALGAALNMVSAECHLQAVSGDESRAETCFFAAVRTSLQRSRRIPGLVIIIRSGPS